MKTVSVVIQPNGEMVLDVDGVKGPACENVLKSLTDRLGETVDPKKKPEYYQTESGGQRAKG